MSMSEPHTCEELNLHDFLDQKVSAQVLNTCFIHGSVEQRDEFMKQYDLTFTQRSVLRTSGGFELLTVEVEMFSRESPQAMEEAFSVLLNIMKMYPNLYYFMFLSASYQEGVTFYGYKPEGYVP